MTSNNNGEPVIEVTATPVGGAPITNTFPYSTETATVTGSTVPQVAGRQNDTAVQAASKLLDNLKLNYDPEKYDFVIEVNEEEEVNKGWFSHMDVTGGIDFEGGKWEASIKGTPKKIRKKKKTTITFGLEEKHKDGKK